MSASCSRPACRLQPVATLTYDYRAQRATLAPLAPDHPMQYDLCDEHASRLSVPRGWVLIDARTLNPATADPSRPERLTGLVSEVPGATGTEGPARHAEPVALAS